MAGFMAKMTMQMAQMNANIVGMQDGVRATVAEAIAPITARMDESARRMDKLENRQRSDMAAVQLKIEQLSKQKENVNATNVATYAVAAKKPAQVTKNTLSACNGDNDWYWDTRKKL